MSLKNEVKIKNIYLKLSEHKSIVLRTRAARASLARQPYLSPKYIVMISRKDKEIDLITKFNLPKVLFKIRT